MAETCREAGMGLRLPRLPKGSGTAAAVAAGSTAASSSKCDDTDEDCKKEIQECSDICKQAQKDPDMRNIWGGNWARCMLGCVSYRCMDHIPDEIPK